MLIALATEPILESSGINQPRKHKQINYMTHPPQTLTHPRKVIMHPQRTYQDVKNDIANQLSGFPNFTAWVKLSEILSHNPGKKCRHCGQQSKSGDLFCAKCGKELPNEYTFTTLKPLGGLGKAALQQRLSTIQSNTIQKGYVRDRTKVEAEIINRQQSCSGSAPVQPQKQQQQPQQPSPQAQARHARNVPVQRTCKTCGAMNTSNARFCNQCGTKL